MNKLFYFGMACLMAIFFGCSKEADYNLVESGCVDLVLPSGTRWQAVGETNSTDQSNFFTYSEATEAFGASLPTKAQLGELVKECNWQWNEDKNGVIVVGPNDNAILFPLTGYRRADGAVMYANSYGYMWTSTADGDGSAWYLRYNTTQVGLDTVSQAMGMGVRLVQDK